MTDDGGAEQSLALDLPDLIRPLELLDDDLEVGELLEGARLGHIGDRFEDRGGLASVT